MTKTERTPSNDARTLNRRCLRASDSQLLPRPAHTAALATPARSEAGASLGGCGSALKASDDPLHERQGFDLAAIPEAAHLCDTKAAAGRAADAGSCSARTT